MNSKQKKLLIGSMAVSVFIGSIVLFVILAKNRKNKKIQDKLLAIVREDLDYWKDITETDRKGAEKLKEWWSWLGYNQSMSDLMSSSWQSENFWSAVYISSVVRRLKPEKNFKYHARHLEYLFAGKEALNEKDQDSMYWTYRANEVPLNIGDIVGKPRQSNLTYDNMTNKGKSHTDIVYKIKKNDSGYTAYLIGGNLSNKVKVVKIELDKKKYIKSPEDYLAIMKFRGL